MELQSSLLQALADWLDEPFDIGIAALLSLRQFVFDMVVGIMLQVLQRKILQFRLQFVKSQFMSQRSVEIGCLCRYLAFHPGGRAVISPVNSHIAYLTHQVHAVGYHNKDDAHVFGKRQQQVAKVLALYDGILLVQLLNALQPSQDACHGLAVVSLYIVNGQIAFLNTRPQQDGDDRITLQANFLDHQLCSLESQEYGVQSEHIPVHLLLFDGQHQVMSHLFHVAVVQCVAQ